MVPIPLHFDTGRLQVLVAATVFTRLRGLLARPPLGRGEAMLIRPCNMIHTVGMRYCIDVVFLARDGTVLRVARSVGPRRVRAHLRAQSVLELAAGEADRLAIVPGALLPVGAL
jgi:uncharacterized membrane protein (UPF0127 family)